MGKREGVGVSTRLQVGSPSRVGGVPVCCKRNFEKVGVKLVSCRLSLGRFVTRCNAQFAARNGSHEARGCRPHARGAAHAAGMPSGAIGVSAGITKPHARNAKRRGLSCNPPRLSETPPPKSKFGTFSPDAITPTCAAMVRPLRHAP